MTTDEWEWKIGVLHGFGERAFQMKGEKVRRVTQIIPSPQGLILAKSLIDVACKGDGEVVYEAAGLVFMAFPLKEDLRPDLERAWGGGVIMPVNGAPRLKLT